MKILLLGEFSSLHKYLKEGFQALGHDVTLASSGDGWKKIGGADIVFPSTSGNFFQRLKALIFDTWLISRKFKGYDVVQLINPVIFSLRINRMIFDFVKKNNRVVSLVAAGLDYALVKSYKAGRFDYYMFDEDKSMLNIFNENTKRGVRLASDCDYIEKNVDVIIPSLYEYTMCHNSTKVSHVIPFPINTDEIEYNENIVGEKVVIFHGLNSEKKKGTRFIREALERLQANYPNEVEVIIDGHMPFDKYLEVISRSNVVIDQCLSYAYGINACISMAQGKVVMAGARKESLEAFGIDACPIIGITPSVDQIYSQLEYILENKNLIPEMGKKSREYVETLHNYKIVAQQYIDIYGKVQMV